MANIQKRPSYTPRRKREKRAYQLAVGGTTAGVVGVAGVVLAAVGVVSFGLPILALIIAALCYVGFQRAVSGR
jgi:uncharacterized membrane protein HdeD (DUF308 family)